jgi:Raf kinase inhibitor-like YbhB/YbcL family protein
MRYAITRALCFLLLLGAAACQNGHANGANSMAIEFSSHPFPSGGSIPKQFTCDGADISPELHWGTPPASTKGFALIADDPDAPVGTWVHWVLFNLPPQLRGLPENVSKQESLDNGALNGRNDFRKIGYGGPCPPPGKPHRYFFKLYALDAMLNLKSGATKADLEHAMKSHILAEGEWMGKYGR